jgi:hypothetical protein
VYPIDKNHTNLNMGKRRLPINNLFTKHFFVVNSDWSAMQAVAANIFLTSFTGKGSAVPIIYYCIEKGWLDLSVVGTCETWNSIPWREYLYNWCWFSELQ